MWVLRVHGVRLRTEPLCQIAPARSWFGSWGRWNPSAGWPRPAVEVVTVAVLDIAHPVHERGQLHGCIDLAVGLHYAHGYACGTGRTRHLASADYEFSRAPTRGGTDVDRGRHEGVIERRPAAWLGMRERERVTPVEVRGLEGQPPGYFSTGVTSRVSPPQ